MATSKELFQFSSLPFLPRTWTRPAILPLLFVLSTFVGAVPRTSAQTSSQQYVYASLPGSPSSSVSGFSKTIQTGALTLVSGSPFNERLEGGLLAIDGQGRFLFVLNPTGDDISMFQIDQASGALSEVPGSPFAVPPISLNTPAPSQPLSIAAERSGKFLFVGYFFAFNGSPGPSSVASLAIDTSGSSPVLLPIESILTMSGGAPIQLLTDSKGLHLYVGLGIGPNRMLVGGAEVYSIDSASGNLLYQGLANSLPSFGRDYAIDPHDRFFFAGGGDVDFLQSCLISPVDGTANNCPPFFYLGFTNNGLLVESSGHFLYIADSPQSVVVYSIDQATGALTQLGSLAGIFSSKGGFIADPMGPYIYTADQTIPSAVHAYQIDQQTGNLTEIPGSPFNPGVPSTTPCCQGLAVSGNPVQAISGPAVTIFPSSAATFNATAGSSSATQIFSIVNVGDQLLGISSISIAGTNASSFSQTNTCLTTLAPNANCSVSITFNPPSAGAFSASLQLADNAPGSPQTLMFNGTGVAPVPAVAFSPAALSFPSTTQGTSSTAQRLTVISSGTGPLHVSSVSLSGPNPSDFSLTNNCTAPVAPAANCTVLLIFSPIAAGQRTANVMIADDALSSPQTVSLSATANAAFTVGAANGSSMSASVSAGQPAQYQLQLAPGSGYSGTISLTCSGAPLGAVCQVPSSVSLTNGSAALLTVTVTTSGPAMLPPSILVRLPPVSDVPLLPFLVFAMMLLICLLGFRAFESATGRNRFAYRGVLLAAIFCAILGVASCGGGSAAVQSPPPIITPSGNSTIVITPSAMSPLGQPLQLQPIQLTLTVK